MIVFRKYYFKSDNFFSNLDFFIHKTPMDAEKVLQLIFDDSESDEEELQGELFQGRNGNDDERERSASSSEEDDGEDDPLGPRQQRMVDRFEWKDRAYDDAWLESDVKLS
ncbi:uncharacterized protein LOC117106811 [Anneissia japonica]|uniref:uncharacterized protein LOC117106811 n=1 Tax=Anneissia japonica TaxID=1529436 RepID=UPI0014254EE4|nr:uncharacterized protein LOC117106811 [Anneissia japonica]